MNSNELNNRLRQSWRSLVLLCGMVSTTLIAQPSMAQASAVVFQLDPAWIGQDGSPLPDWTASVTVTRDGSAASVTPRPFHLPKSALKDPRLQGLFLIETTDNSSAASLNAVVSRARGVKWSEVTAVRHTDEVKTSNTDGADAPTGDPFYLQQWYLHRIQAPAAWDITKGDTNVVIAVIDVGVDIDHGDLIAQQWINWSEKNGQVGVDDDGNGFIDDINGWDFTDDDSDPRPENGDAHGTHVAGIASAATDNDFGIAGIGWKSRIMAVRAGNGSSITHGFEGLIYAATSGADVANLSWGSELSSHLERIAIDFASDHGCLVVAASGNNDGHTSFDHFPAAYTRTLAVAGLNDKDMRGYFSNAAAWVDISAPGDKILSLFPNNLFGVEDGTSMATPMVAGAAGLVKAVHPDWTPDRVAMQLITSADPIDAINVGNAGMLGSGRLNLYRAVADQRVRFGLVAIHVDDSTRGNGNGMIDPAERINLYLEIQNLLSLPSTADLTLQSNDPTIVVDAVTVPFAQIAPGAIVSTQNSPFRFRVAANTSAGHVAKLVLKIERNGLLLQELPFEITIRPAHGELTSSQLSVTISDFGALGYYDYLNGKGVGVGFRFPADGLSTLYHGSLQVGVPGVGVSDCAYGNAEKRRIDFRPLNDGVGVVNEGQAVAAHIAYDDVRAESPLGLTVFQSAFIYPVDSAACLILDYRITDSPREYDSVYVGLYLDWDIVQADANLIRYDSEQKIGWMERKGVNSGLFGGTVLNQAPTFQYGIDNRDIQRSFSDSTKLTMMMSGTTFASSDSVEDWSQFFGVGPLHLIFGDTLHLTFAIGAGKNQADLYAALETGRRRFGNNIQISHNSAPQLLSIESLYPMPFNGAVTVVSRSLSGLPVNWRLIDPMGRVAYSGNATTIGERIKLGLDFKDLAAGKYYFEMTSGNSKATAPMILLK